MSAHQRILAGSFGFSQPQSLNVSFRSTERQTPKAALLQVIGKCRELTGEWTRFAHSKENVFMWDLLYTVLSGVWRVFSSKALFKPYFYGAPLQVLKNKLSTHHRDFIPIIEREIENLQLTQLTRHSWS